MPLTREGVRDCISACVCPLCGAGPFLVLAKHTGQAHGIDRFELRKMAGLNLHTSICAPETSDKARAHNRDKNTIRNVGRGRMKGRKRPPPSDEASENMRNSWTPQRRQVMVNWNKSDWMREQVSKGRLFSPEVEAEIEERYLQGGISQEALGRIYGVGQTTIGALLRRRRRRNGKVLS